MLLVNKFIIIIIIVIIIIIIVIVIIIIIIIIVIIIVIIIIIIVIIIIIIIIVILLLLLQFQVISLTCSFLHPSNLLQVNFYKIVLELLLKHWPVSHLERVIGCLTC